MQQEPSGFDFLSDSYSTEIIAIMVAERLWSKISAYIDARHMKVDKQKDDDRLDEIAERLARLEGKTEKP